MSDNSGFDFSKEVEKVKSDKNLMMVVGGAIAVIIGLFLPWYSISIFGLNQSFSPGLSGDGIFLFLFSVGAVVTSLNLLKKDTKAMAVTTIVFAVLAALVMFADWPDDELGEFVSVGLGYWLGVIGSLSMIAGSVKAKMANKAPTKTESTSQKKSDK